MKFKASSKKGNNKDSSQKSFNKIMKPKAIPQKIIRINKSLAKLTQKRGEDKTTQITRIKNEKGNITTNFRQIKIIKGYMNNHVSVNYVT